jgi:nucleotide-binding universal stress UspA family protein
MTDDLRNPLHPGPMLLCAGTDRTAAARLAEVAASLLGDRPAIVLATWEPPPIVGFESAMDALFDAYEEVRHAARQAATETAHAAADALEAHGVHVTRQICPEEQAPWQEILAAADQFGAGVIVAGTTEDSAARPGALGRQARALAHHAHRPLLLVPADAVPVGDDEPAIFGGHADDAAGRLAAAGWSCEATALETSRNVPTGILATADERDAAIVVTGTCGRSRAAAALLGSSAEAIVRHAGRPVLLVPPSSSTED